MPQTIPPMSLQSTPKNGSNTCRGWSTGTIPHFISPLATPFQVLYGKPPPTVINYLTRASVVEEVDKELQERDDLLRQLEENLNKASNRMKLQADKKRQDCELEFGDWVYLRLQPYRQSSLFGEAIKSLPNGSLGHTKLFKELKQ